MSITETPIIHQQMAILMTRKKYICAVKLKYVVPQKGNNKSFEKTRCLTRNLISTDTAILWLTW